MNCFNSCTELRPGCDHYCNYENIKSHAFLWNTCMLNLQLFLGVWEPDLSALHCRLLSLCACVAMWTRRSARRGLGVSTSFMLFTHTPFKSCGAWILLNPGNHIILISVLGRWGVMNRDSCPFYSPARHFPKQELIMRNLGTWRQSVDSEMKEDKHI